MKRVLIRMLLLIGFLLIFFGPWNPLFDPFGDQIQKRAGSLLASKDVSLLIEAIKAYHTECGTTPTGDSISILSSLRGNNPQKAVFLAPEHRFDAQGNFLDPWKSPYRIDVSDPKNPKVWSPGKNKIDEHDDPKSDDICSWR